MANTVIVVGLLIVLFGAGIWAFRPPTGTGTSVIKFLGLELTLDVPALGVMAIGVVLVLLGSTMSPRPISPVSPEPADIAPAPSPVVKPPINAEPKVDAPPAPAKPAPKTLTHPTVEREGKMHGIKVTLIPNGAGGGVYNIDFYWSGGTWSGTQNAIVTFVGDNDARLQSVMVPIDRSGCFYGGGNHQIQGGQLTVDPATISGLEVTLSEVHNKTEDGC
ncbi:hypothetical protein FJ936_13540 [Mesorhizobium sp. B2-4-13]|uniref:hypothetical protein n=1 Tax=Mesorhizobium sp. B2-4-13 TaxID=2589936 RepID=UPI001154C1ED|nr:hypothetical protein [Mesorhizobium sp. B2-4-13]TPK84892.1 hypothetical protein FJ936_13540 [Mesorhizobium sp. B2-4-13]